MRQPARALALATATVAAACLIAGCGHSGAISGAIASSSVTIPPVARPSVSVPVATTAPPTTAPPTTAPPTTAPPTTAPPTTAPSTPPPSSAAAASPAPSGTAVAVAGSDSAWPWIWAAIGAVLLAGLITWIAVAAKRRSARRSASAASWRSHVIEAYAEGAALHDSIGLAQTPGSSDGEDAGARWSGLQARADDFTRTLYRLREAAPDDEARIRVGETLSSLQALLSAITAERASGRDLQASAAETVRSRLSFFAASLQALRLSDERPV
jgi:hypothetical protein